jgi:hypothetical protein
MPTNIEGQSDIVTNQTNRENILCQKVFNNTYTTAVKISLGVLWYYPGLNQCQCVCSIYENNPTNTVLTLQYFTRLHDVQLSKLVGQISDIFVNRRRVPGAGAFRRRRIVC